MYKREGEKEKILFLGLDNLIYIAGEINIYVTLYFPVKKQY